MSAPSPLKEQIEQTGGEILRLAQRAAAEKALTKETSDELAHKARTQARLLKVVRGREQQERDE